MDPTLEELARRAVAGERDAVERLVRGLQRDVHAIALRMLWHREDAEDATQERFADDLTQGLSTDGAAEGERSLLTEEVKIGCTLGMLQCLDRPHRLAYVLGGILELPASEAAEALGL